MRTLEMGQDIMEEMKWLWGKIGKDKYKYIVALFGSVIVSVMAIVAPHVSSLIVDRYIAGPNSIENLRTDRQGLIFLIIFMIAFTLFRTILAYLTMMLFEKVSQNVVYTIRTETYEIIQKQDRQYFYNHRIGDFMTRLTGDIDMIRHSIAWIIKTVVESLVVFVVAIVYLFNVNAKLTLWIVSLSPLILFVAFFLSKEVRPRYIQLRKSFSGLNTVAQENIAANKVVKAFAQEEYEIHKFNEKSDAYRRANEEVTFTWLKYNPILELVAQGFSVILLFMGGLYIMRGELSFGQFAAFSALLSAIANPMRHVGIVINDLQRFYVSVGKIREIYFAKSKIVKTAYIDNPTRFEGHIEFENVSFKYGNKTVFENLNLEIKPKETLAILGSVGSGKTTLINLIARLYDVNSGQIKIDGINIKDYPLDTLRANIAIATQKVMLFSDTIYENIGYGMKVLNEDEIVQSAKDARAHDFILKTEDGYQTLIGEEGVGLSGGQRQRLALSRAFASDRPILILDDTTSAVDNETEIEIAETLKRNKDKMTQIIITQRITTAMYADRIIVLDQGDIVESGSHEALLQEKGYYSDMAKLQELGGEV